MLLRVLIFDAPALGGSQNFDFCDSRCRPMHTFSRERAFEPQHFGTCNRTLAAEVLQKKKMSTPLMRESHFRSILLLAAVRDADFLLSLL